MRKLKDLKYEILNHLYKSCSTYDFSTFTGLIIKDRQPHTTRLSFLLGSERICLHIFEPAKNSECFPHPHSWPCEVTILKGVYAHSLLNIADLKTDYSHVFSNLNSGGLYLYKHVLTRGGSYEMMFPNMWHKVVPLKKCYTIMINGPQFDKYSKHCTFTKGEEVVEISKAVMEGISRKFISLLESLN